jgi:hypothetical protein
MPSAAFIAARRRRSKKSGKNESVEFTECEQQLPGCCGWCRWHLHAEFFSRSSPARATCLRMQCRSIKSAKIPKSLHSVLRVESFAQGSSRGKFLFYLKIQMWP